LGEYHQEGPAVALEDELLEITLILPLQENHRNEKSIKLKEKT